MGRLSGTFARGSIARRLAILVIAASSVITIVTTAIQLYADYTHDIEGINEGFSSLESSHLQSLVQLVWAANGDQIQIHLDGLVRLPDLEYLAISVDGKTRWKAGQRRSKRRISKRFPLIFKYVDKNVEIGVLTAHGCGPD